MGKGLAEFIPFTKLASDLDLCSRGHTFSVGLRTEGLSEPGMTGYSSTTESVAGHSLYTDDWKRLSWLVGIGESSTSRVMAELDKKTKTGSFYHLTEKLHALTWLPKKRESIVERSFLLLKKYQACKKIPHDLFDATSNLRVCCMKRFVN